MYADWLAFILYIIIKGIKKSQILISLHTVNKEGTRNTDILMCMIWCITDSSDPIKCDPGKYCQTEGPSAVTGNCLAGYYCILQAKISTPTDGVTGNICPAGYYCESGSTTPTPCSPETYAPSQGNTKASWLS